MSFIYIFIRFISSLLNPWFWFYLGGLVIIGRLMGGWFCCVNEIGCIGGIVSRVGFVAGEVEIGVLMVLVLILVLVLAKLFLRR